MNKVYQNIRNGSLGILYGAVFLLLMFGVLSTSDSDKMTWLLLAWFSFSLMYRVSKAKVFPGFIERLPQLKLAGNAGWVLVIIGAVLALSHLLYLGHLPAVSAIGELKMSEVVAIRRSIVADAHPIWNYLASFNVKAILPFAVLLTFVNSKRFGNWHWLVLVLGIIYTASLMQKSYILFLIIPVLIHALLQKRFIRAAVYAAIAGIVVFGLTWVANPAKRGGVNDTKVELASASPTTDKTIVGSLVHRVFVVPGEVVGKWLETVPDHKPFLYGDGYRLVAKLKGTQYRDYAREMYPIVRPQYAGRGLEGKANTASFMYEYVNFGWLGLLLSGAVLGCLLGGIEVLFTTDKRTMLALNAFPIFMLSSGALTTTLFSGGWGLTLLLYFLFREPFNPKTDV